MKGDDFPDGQPAFRILSPAEPGPVIFAVPHAGRRYPGLHPEDVPGGVTRLRSIEDPLVDQLIEPMAALGAHVIVFDLARAFVDVNRDPRELDPQLLETPDPGRARPTARTRAGFGVVPRLAADGRPLLNQRLALEEIDARLAGAHAPYHDALGALMRSARDRFGFALLLDWHSMPSAAAQAEHRRSGRHPDIVIGDRHGRSCAAAWSGSLRQLFEGQGRAVAMNRPFAGGHVTERWGRPDDGLHAIQVEIDRGLYLDESRLEPIDGFAALADNIAVVTRALVHRR